MAFTEDLSVFFDTDDFAVSAAFTPRSGGAATNIKGIFDKEYVAVGDGAEVAVAATQPMFQTASAGLTAARGGTLVVDGVTYTIVEVKPDGTGTTILILEDAS